MSPPRALDRIGRLTSRARLHVWLIPLCLIVLFAGVRLARIDADPPSTYPSGRVAQELLVEGPAKSNEARRYGLFGTFSRRPSDEYRIWSIQSPVYVLPLGSFFRTFGTGFTQLRAFAALTTALGLLAFYALAREHSRRVVAPLACLTFALSFHDAMLTRSGLLEPYLNGWLALAFLCAVRSLRSLPWLFGCTLAFAAAILTKQTAAMAAPALVAVALVAQLTARRRTVPWWQHAASLGFGIAVGVALLLYVKSPAYWRTVEWNFGHMIEGEERHHAVSMGGVRLGEVMQRLGDTERWKAGLFEIAPLAPLALLQLGRTVVELIRRRRVEAIDLVAGAWFLSAFIALQLTEHVRARFSVILVPPCSLLAASFVAFLVDLLAPRRARYVPVAAVVLALVATDGRWLFDFWRAPKHELRDAGKRLSRALGPDDVVIGSRAPLLGFDTRADLYYAKGPFNMSRAAMGGLGVTHLLLERGDRAGKRAAALFPKDEATKKRRMKVELRGKKHTLYELAHPLGHRPVDPI